MAHGKNLITSLALIGIAFIAMGNASACGVFGNHWYKLTDRGLGLSSPIIKVEYRGGSLFRNGKHIERSILLNELKGGAALQPHPRVLLILRRSDCEKIRRLVKQIERSGICKDSGCLYQFQVRRRT